MCEICSKLAIKKLEQWEIYSEKCVKFVNNKDSWSICEICSNSSLKKLNVLVKCNEKGQKNFWSLFKVSSKETGTMYEISDKKDISLFFYQIDLHVSTVLTILQ